MTIEQFAKQHRLRIQRDRKDGTDIIPGRKGKSHLFEHGDGLHGVAIMPDTQTGHFWNAARNAFAKAGMEIGQDGDHEGTTTFDPANPEQVRLALKYADVKRKRKMSEKERLRLIKVGFKKRPQAVPLVSQNESADTVEDERTSQKPPVEHG